MKHKFFAKKVFFDGHKFDSSTEMEIYKELKQDLADGKINSLHLQVPFKIIEKLTKEIVVRLKTKSKVVVRVDEMAAHYTPDFVYIDNTTGNYIMLEVKSFATANLADYILRRKLIKRIIKSHNAIRPNGQWEFRELKVTKKRNRGKKSS